MPEQTRVAVTSHMQNQSCCSSGSMYSIVTCKDRSQTTVQTSRPAIAGQRQGQGLQAYRFELAVDLFGDLGVCCDNCQSPYALTIQPHVLGVTLHHNGSLTLATWAALSTGCTRRSCMSSHLSCCSKHACKACHSLRSQVFVIQVYRASRLFASC